MRINNNVFGNAHHVWVCDLGKFSQIIQSVPSFLGSWV